MGDCAAVMDPTSKLPYPPPAQHALREGRRAGENIYARLQRVALQWALDIVFDRDLGQYLTRRDVDSLNRLLESSKGRGTKVPPQNCNTAVLKRTHDDFRYGASRPF